MDETRVAASYVRLLFEHMAALGLADALGTPPAADEDFVALKRWQALLAHARDLDPGPRATFPLRLARGIAPRHFGVVGFAALACGTLGDALQRLERHHRAVYDVNLARVRPTVQGLSIEWGVERGRPGALVDETAIASLVQLTRDMTGRPLRPLAVDFVNPQPPDLRPYTDFFGAPVRFDQPGTRLLLAAQDLALPLRGADADLLALLDAQAERLLQQVAAVSGPVVLWRQALVGQIRSGHTSLADLAANLQMSPRSLQRRLAEQGHSFQALLSDTRRQLAEAYLRDPQLELAEVALLLGYSEQSAFTRAFRQWTGLAPLQWRRQHHNA
ncbi:AraC family transcriptional regulator ligand-binding domain-containing protein [Roseateles asaccharophilus]|uniref:AraC-like DNA-binding protein n=1 Tax=Roseateles asaccharophilus TaxID=582607 RepID=A0ABU2A535_9BURK|nr:AraC family transcriptional regulator ligand-binding domain-containing protein [Roseateles asaccharophilus]MDR7331617.1 AraC-like DNA-binding protein [Roseateles asaccharophilus]